MTNLPRTIESRLQTHQSLAQKTTLGVGGAAEFFFAAESTDDVIAACNWARANSLPVWILSGGSNLVIADAGVHGLIVEIRTRGIEVTTEASRVLVTAAAGENWDEFVRAVAEKGYCGLECLSGIPGRVGATPIQNVGAYGQDVAQRIAHVDVYLCQTNEAIRLRASECEFSYRSSRFRAQAQEPLVILSVCYALSGDARPQVTHVELSNLLANNGVAQPTALDVRSAVLQLRRAKSMLLDRADPWARSCGSFFINPIVPAELARGIEAQGQQPRAPIYSVPNGKAKIAAAWLIEQAGFSRGFRQGSVGLSGKHSLAIVAYDGATACDVCDLARTIQAAVRQRFGVELWPEPAFWGFDKLEHGLPVTSRAR